jgi:predicted nucleic-acid-binding Zn-ribbon protein
MTYWCLTLIFLFLTSSVSAQEKGTTGTNTMKILKIERQRLVTERQTCPRCGATEKEVEKALQTLEQSLAPLGVKVALEKQKLNHSEFQKDPLQSNRIWIEGRSLEDWLGLKVGQTPCCQTCGDAECRTLETSGQVYESIPAELIVKASLLAASKLVGPQTSEAGRREECRSDETPPAMLSQIVRAENLRGLQ